MNYYRRYVGDYLKDTARLSVLEHGAYTLLLDHYYAEEQPIPLSMPEVYTMVRAMTTADRKAVDKVLGKYFTREADGFHNARADHEIEVSRTARDNGGGGGRPKKTGRKTGEVTGSQTGLETGKVTGVVTGIGGGSGHPPTTNHQPPASNPHPPTATEKPSAAARREGEGRTVETWHAYAGAYQQRWGVAPTRNKTVNGQLAKFLERVPMEEAPDIAAFYVQSNRGLYVSAKHPITLLLRDAEALRTEYLTGRQGTETEARRGDRTATTGAVFKELIDEAREREALPKERKSA